MRSPLLLAALLCACTVVPTPTTGSPDVSAHPELSGTWRTRSVWNSDTLVQRLALFGDGGYERWAIDSNQASGIRTVLTEQGFWSILSTDTGRILFTPSTRFSWPTTAASLGAAVLTTDTASWSVVKDSLRITLRQWWQRDQSETLVYGRN